MHSNSESRRASVTIISQCRLYVQSSLVITCQTDVHSTPGKCIIDPLTKEKRHSHGHLYSSQSFLPILHRPSRLTQMRMQLLHLFLLWSMILARHTDDFRGRATPPSARIFDYHCGQSPTFDAPGVEPYAVLGQLQAAARVVAVDDGRAEAARKTSLVFVPELSRRLARSIFPASTWTVETTYLGPRRTVGTATRDMRIEVNSPHAHYCQRVLPFELNARY